MGFEYPASKGAKAYFIQHYEVHEGMPADRVDATWRLPMHKIVIANWLAELSRERFGDAGYSLVPNSVDMMQFFAPPHGKQPRPTIGMMYSHVPFKGCDIAPEGVFAGVAKRAWIETDGVWESPADARFTVAAGRGVYMSAAAEGHLGDLRGSRCMAIRQPVGGVWFADPRGDGVSHAGDRDARRRARSCWPAEGES